MAEVYDLAVVQQKNCIISDIRHNWTVVSAGGRFEYLRQLVNYCDSLVQLLESLAEAGVKLHPDQIHWFHVDYCIQKEIEIQNAVKKYGGLVAMNGDLIMLDNTMLSN